MTAAAIAPRGDPQVALDRDPNGNKPPALSRGRGPGRGHCDSAQEVLRRWPGRGSSGRSIGDQEVTMQACGLYGEASPRRIWPGPDGPPTRSTESRPMRLTRACSS
ncbi:hypothetical protein GCM10010495_52350 [Kitasatospora herbaricolor]|nr:hypothetical protein GCM10010495_52350 [Kitasatospora herbaricolor]